MVWQKATSLSPKQSVSNSVGQEGVKGKDCPKNSSRWQEEFLCYTR